MTLNDLNSNVTLKILTICLALLQPLIILFFLGQIHSISSVWNTCLQPMFIITNAATSFYFMLMSRWRFSGIMLMLLTAFSVNLFPLVHNIFALTFFVSVLFSFKKYDWYFYIYLLAIPIYFIVNMLWAEIFAILIIAIYHLELLIRLKKV